MNKVQSKDDDTPDLGVVIPSFNGREELAACLSSLHFSIYPRLITVVVDNGSTDGSSDYVRHNWPSIILVAQPTNTGFAAACNRGVNELKKRGVKYAFLLNQDTTVEANWAQPLVEYLENHDDVVAAQSLLLRAGGEYINSVGNRIHFLGFGYAEGDGRSAADSRVQKFLRGPVEINYASGAAVLIKMEIIKKLGLFQDEFFMYHEDLDFGWRMRLAGYKSVLVPESRVYHRYDFHRSNKIKYEYGERNRLIVLLENYQLLTLVLIFPAWFVMEIGIVTISLMKGWFPEKMSGYKYIIKKMPEILKVRRYRQSQRRVSDRVVAANFSGMIAYQDEPSILLKIFNPFFNLCWKLIRLFLL